MDYVPIWERDAEARGERLAYERAYKRGYERGYKRGVIKAKISIAKKMLKREFAIDLIMELTDLKQAEIEKLSATLH